MRLAADAGGAEEVSPDYEVVIDNQINENHGLSFNDAQPMTVHLHLTGLVQGVGFRPFVWQLARAMNLTGTVGNGPDGVHIYINADTETARQFRHRVLSEAPALARIQSAVLTETEPRFFPDFSIVESVTEGPATALLTPDLALCAACRDELSDPTNRRFGYAFTTCTHCGPRYSISRALPYDRPATTMASFGMCAHCEAEYHDPANRRFYAQTNSCPDCAVTMRLYDREGQCVSDNQTTLIERVSKLLEAGETVAVKGIGGYLLLVNATNPLAISQLRKRKHRPTKPLAVLYPSVDSIRQDCRLHDNELAWLVGPVSPIILLDLLPVPASGIDRHELAPGLGQLGVMLPYAPLLALIASAFGKPLVATSGNVSGSPICYTDEQSLTHLPAVADYILTHNRAIVVPQDDSVLRLSATYRQPIVLRRSRGMAPTVIPALAGEQEQRILAFGASLKSTFAGQWRGNTYVSQYLGDLESFDTQTNFRNTLAHLLTLFDSAPTVVLADRHEGYFSTQLARDLAITWRVPLVTIQHHEGHLAAVLAENALLDTTKPVLGIIWDGTGYGTDGQIWGGEFITYRNETDSHTGTGPGRFSGVAHFEYFSSLLGDKMPREPRLSALSLAYGLPGADARLRVMFSPTEWALYPKLLATNALKTSSVGRLFDAVAALLGLADNVSYEGEAAMLLEERASRYVRANGFTMSRHYLPAIWSSANVPTRAIIAGVLHDALDGKPTDQIAASFHYTLVAVVRVVAGQTGINQLAFSGGVFQNALLMDWLRHDLGDAHPLYFHRDLSPNDECIAYGQLAHFLHCSHNATTVQTETDYVFSHSR